MATFTDRRGRVWAVELDTVLFARVRDRAGVDLDAVVDQLAGLFARDGGATRADQIERLCADRQKLFAVAWVLCEEQAAAQAPPVAPEEFGRGFGGGTHEDFADALLTELITFTPRQTGRLLTAGLAKLRAEQDAAVGAAIDRLGGLTLSTPATSGAASSDSTPAPAG